MTGLNRSCGVSVRMMALALTPPPPFHPCMHPSPPLRSFTTYTLNGIMYNSSDAKTGLSMLTGPTDFAHMFDSPYIQGLAAYDAIKYGESAVTEV